MHTISQRKIEQRTLKFLQKRKLKQRVENPLEHINLEDFTRQTVRLCSWDFTSQTFKAVCLLI